MLFRGIHDGRSYPESFDEAVYEFCETYECTIVCGHAVRSQMTGEGGTCKSGTCKSGMLFLEMSVNGDAYRCGTDRSRV
jgi:hypothetical protein